MTDKRWDPVHPDTLVGPELDELMALFGDIYWQDQAAVEQRVADLRALTKAGYVSQARWAL